MRLRYFVSWLTISKTIHLRDAQTSPRTICGKRIPDAGVSTTRQGHGPPPFPCYPARCGRCFGTAKKGGVAPLPDRGQLASYDRHRLEGYVHRSLAAKALGGPLPEAAQVHHVRGKGNAPGNLVVCEDQFYHQLLHKRQRALDACGNPNWRKCRYCQHYDDPANLYIRAYTVHHRACSQKYHQRQRVAA